MVEILPYRPLKNITDTEKPKVEMLPYKPLKEAERVTPIVEEPAGTSRGRREAREERRADNMVGEDERGESTRQEILQSEDDMFYIRRYMMDRKGAKYEKENPEKLLDDFIKHMRYVNVNELNTLSEARYVQNAEETKKDVTGKAYMAYDKLAPFYDSGSWKDTGAALIDYTTAAIVNPSNLLGGIFGKIAGRAASAGARRTLTATALRAAKEAAKRGAGKEGARAAATNILKRGAQTEAGITIASTTAIDGLSAMAQDSIFQNTEIEVGNRQSVDKGQVLISGLFGTVGGGLSAIPQYTKAISPKLTNRTIVEAQRKLLRENQEKIAERFRGFAEKVIPNIRQNLETYGYTFDGKSESVLAEELAKIMFDTSDEFSIINIMKDVGAPIKSRKEGETAFMNVVDFIETIKEYDDELYDTLAVPFKEAFGVSLGDTIGQVGEIVSSGTTVAARISNAVRWAEKSANRNRISNAASIEMEREMVEQLAKEAGLDLDEAAKMSPDALRKAASEGNEDLTGTSFIQWAQSLWRRSLVSHLSTSALNVAGFAQASGKRTATDLVQAALHGGIALGYMPRAAFDVNKRSIANGHLRKAGRLLSNQAYKFRTMLDPYSTLDNFKKLLDQSEYAKKQMSRSFFAGIEANPAKVYGMDKNAIGKIGENYAEIATRLSLVRLQDSWSKSLVGMSELDKQIKLNPKLSEQGINSLDDVLTTGRVDVIDDEMWKTVVDRSLKDAFSADYTRGKAAFNQIAKIVEEISAAPGIGFFFPFGRFMNNIMAHVGTYSPLNAMSLGVKMATKSGRQQLTPDIITERAAQSLVGTSLIAGMMHIDILKQQEGQAWNEEIDNAGTTVDVGFAAPNSIYRNGARIANRILAGESPDGDLVTNFIDQLGAGAYLQEVGQSGRQITGGIQSLADFFNNIDEDNIGQVKSVLEEQESVLSGRVFAAPLGLVSDLASGYLRPLDVPNTVVGAITGNDENIDRRQLEKDPIRLAKANVFRYVDSMVEAATGKRIGPVKNSATNTEPTQDPNPIGTLFGHREVQTKEPIDVMLAENDFASWRQDERSGIPERDDVINEHVTPYLNGMAKAAMSSSNYQNASFDMKRAITRHILTGAKKYVRDLADDGVFTGSEGIVNGLRASIEKRPKDVRREAFRALDISSGDLHLLSYSELVKLDAYIQMLEDRAELFETIRK